MNEGISFRSTASSLDDAMNPVDYDAWYDTSRGRWIGTGEFALLDRMLAPRSGESLLDVGCGTGWFTRQIANQTGVDVTGIDLNVPWLHHARMRDCHSTYLAADARMLPFASRSFDRTLSVTALNFIDEWELALQEIVRVTRKRFAIGVLNRTSLLWRATAKNSGKASYQGAHWHSPRKIVAALHRLPVRNIHVRSAIFIPSGSACAIFAERVLPKFLRYGGFLLLSAEPHAWKSG